MSKIQSGTLWQHKKGGVYQVVTECTIEETDTPAVMYKCLNIAARDDFWVRTRENFLERFDAINVTNVEIAETLKDKAAYGHEVSP